MVWAFFVSYTPSLFAQNERPQCVAITKKGQKCKNKAMEGSIYCNVHKAKEIKSQRCKARTKSGRQCSRSVTRAGYCTQHYNIYVLGK